MVIERSVLIFPKFSNEEIINSFREKYDPIAKYVRPHVTLVFPFKSDISGCELKRHIEECLVDFKSFKLVLKGTSIFEENYIFLDVSQGNDELTKLHKRLYSNILNVFYPDFLRSLEYRPHMTIGRYHRSFQEEITADLGSFRGETFEDIINKISVEIIDENEDSILEMELELK